MAQFAVMNKSIRKLRRRFSLEQKDHWVLTCLNSNLSQREFAERNQLCLSALQRWLAARRGKVANAKSFSGAIKAAQSSIPAFVEVKAPAPSRSWAAEVVRRDGAIVRLAHDSPATLIQQLLSCC